MEPMATATEITNMKARFEQEVASEKLTPLQKASYKIQKGWLNEKVGLVEIIAYPGWLITIATLKNAYAINIAGYGGPGVPKTNATYLTLLMVMQHPFSRGNTHINSSDPLAPPQIDPRCLSKSIDLETLVYSVKFGQKLSKTEPLASIVVTRQDPAPDVTSDAAISEYIKANIGSSHHSIGTVALAPKEHGGVVDTKLKVYGTANVRVADASIMPLHIGSHTQRTVYGIGEKAAKIIKST
ncbi:Alcohol oxidase Short=AOX [Rhizoctonia solani AG-1 IB]|uniref:Alcohol oxidase Short=AOX n=1 Tax=Thanatephorus cucumeris (strain AG1-IB / isolate 7/3/14) TaxID=1108050 RepID=M5C9Z3_THACB|nr:Alcohol oxidase Short=AOX [Rhizoctonia solani AG-1 IB]